MVVAAGLTLGPLAGAIADWSRQTVDILDSQTAFIIVSTTSSFGQLSAGAVYRYIDGKEPVLLTGRKDSHGDFWPSVSYELGTEGTKKWKRIGSFTLAEVPVTVRFDAENPNGLLRVDMEPFRSSIGKVRWGRVVLPNGDAAEIMLDNLLPMPESRDASGDFKKDVTDPQPTRFGSVFALVSITSFSNHLVGDFVFCARQRTFAEIKGANTVDGEFWPAVTFQCGNEDGEWQTVGTSGNRGKRTALRLSARGPLRPVRVPLDAYQPCQGRFKYG